MSFYIDMKVENILGNNSINRHYRIAKKIRNANTFVMFLNLGFAAQDAAMNKPGWMLFFLGVSGLFAKRADKVQKAMNLIKSEYQEILNRAKSIKKLR